MIPGLAINRQERLRQKRHYRQTYIQGRRLRGPYLSICFKPNQLNFNRLGLAVSKKRFKLSTHRHYIQRCLREAFRLNKMRLLTGFDIVITALSFNADKIRFNQLNQEFLSLAQKASLLKKEQ